MRLGGLLLQGSMPALLLVHLLWASWRPVSYSPAGSIDIGLAVPSNTTWKCMASGGPTCQTGLLAEGQQPSHLLLMLA